MKISRHPDCMLSLPSVENGPAFRLIAMQEKGRNRSPDLLWNWTQYCCPFESSLSREIANGLFRRPKGGRAFGPFRKEDLQGG